MDDKQAFFVQSEDGRKFKMVIRGDLGKLSVGKIRRYLKSYGIPDGQLLLYDGVVLEDSAVGGDFGLKNNSMLQLVSPRRGTVAAEVRSKPTSNPTPHVSGEKRSSSTHRATSTDTHARHSERPSSRPLTTATVSHVDPSSMSDGLSQTNVVSSTALGSNMNSKNNGKNIGSSLSATLEVENSRLRDEVDRLHQELSELRGRQKCGDGGVRTGPVLVDLLQNAKSNLQELSEELGVSLQFDMNLTCVIGTDERHTVLVTFDHATERLYVYSTLLTQLPVDAAVRVKLYELLLEGSLLGREVCGGGIGMSLQSGIVLLSTSIPLRNCSTSALKDIMPSFVETLGRWRSLINELLD
ncbi:hypothetical protein TCSYLVIO_004710 [Trypanosoma cruzi]|uniref:Ubiquitin-like domain-containing protein n=1 Tax=Trypanosoma cruzi Dm28c TaxID=1416333 RepID=V5BJ53_TRYCR|nr:hypothetical protein TCSYLVIO_004710 [Trypanosoma cruzi]ESS67799.1 hypothetical protein TCDM_03519 [Trypanosoma cruzi Dm28c]RNF19596.1 hypothetical protein TcG_04177 [Trypanosoma cruzi]